MRNNGGGVELHVRRVKVGSSNPEDVFSLKDLTRYDGTSGFWSDATPDGSRMFARDASGRDLYAFDVDFFQDGMSLSWDESKLG